MTPEDIQRRSDQIAVLQPKLEAISREHAEMAARLRNDRLYPDKPKQ